MYNSVIEQLLVPQNFPQAEWLGASRHSLVLQQAAVNVALKLKDDGILAINGPPGTGKTTLLRDVIAEVITKRALALSKFYDPAHAFIDSGKK